VELTIEATSGELVIKKRFNLGVSLASSNLTLDVVGLLFGLFGFLERNNKS
jgi:hypothetical protein